MSKACENRFPTSSQFFLVLACLLAICIQACAVPVANGPFYQPLAPLHVGADGKGAWLAPSGKSGRPDDRLRVGLDSTNFMEISATADEDNFLLSFRFSCGLKACKLKMGEDPIVITDLETNQTYSLQTVRRIFGFSKPKVALEKGLVSQIAGFKNLPPEQQRYTVSLPVRLEYPGVLPDKVTLQLPPMNLGYDTLSLPPLVLSRAVPGKSMSAYVPQVFSKLSRTQAYSRFVGSPVTSSSHGTFGAYFPAVYQWHEVPGRIAVAAEFMGRDDDAWKSVGKPFIGGDIRVLVLSGEKLTLSHPSVLWSQAGSPNDTQEVPISNARHEGNLSMYTTKLGDQTEWTLSSGQVPDNPHFLAVQEKLASRHVRITMPPIWLGGEPLPSQPIEFKYVSGSIGLGIWP